MILPQWEQQEQKYEILKIYNLEYFLSSEDNIIQHYDIYHDNTSW